MRFRSSLFSLSLIAAALCAAPAPAPAQSSSATAARADSTPVVLASAPVHVDTLRVLAVVSGPEVVATGFRSTEQAVRVALHIDELDGVARDAQRITLTIGNSPEPLPFRQLRSYRPEQIMRAVLIERTSRDNPARRERIVHVDVQYADDGVSRS